MKPGWKTTEFWIAAVGQVLALLVILGAVNNADRSTLEGALTAGITAVFTLLASAGVIVNYVSGRVRLKVKADDAEPAKPPSSPPNGPRGVVVPAVLLAMGLLAGPLSAQTFYRPATAPVVQEVRSQGPGVKPVALLPWRQKLEDELRRSREENKQLLERIIDLVSKQQQPAPPAAPQITREYYIYYLPKQELPIPGEPRQLLPIPGDPRQLLPIPGDPKQLLPLPGPPKQLLPGPGVPKQDLPGAGEPKQPLPGPPGYYMPPAAQPGQRPPIVEEYRQLGPPQGYQRFARQGQWPVASGQKKALASRVD